VLMPALDGMRVLDFTQYEAGPSCCQYLAWLGADVVKIEPPRGEPGRKTGAPNGGKAQYFENYNANKRSVAVDVATGAGRDLLRRLVAGFDVFVENQGPHVMEKLGLDPLALQSDHPSLIYARIKGYGLSGPYAEYRSFDMLAQDLAEHDRILEGSVEIGSCDLRQSNALRTAINGREGDGFICADCLPHVDFVRREAVSVGKFGDHRDGGLFREEISLDVEITQARILADPLAEHLIAATDTYQMRAEAMLLMKPRLEAARAKPEVSPSTRGARNSSVCAGSAGRLWMATPDQSTRPRSSAGSPGMLAISPRRNPSRRCSARSR